MNLGNDHNKIKTDIAVAENRIKDLETRSQILHASIADILKDKRKIDKYHMEIEDKLLGKNISEEQTKLKAKNEERRMRIGYQFRVDRLKSDYLVLYEKTADEEQKSKDVLEQKLKDEQELLDTQEDLKKIEKSNEENRMELIKARTKNSQLDT